MSISVGGWGAGAISVNGWGAAREAGAQADLGAAIEGVYQLQSSDLSASITPFVTSDLQAYIYAGTFQTPSDLGAYINTVEPKDLPASIHSYATKDLSASTTGVYSPYDIRAILTAITSKELLANIHGYRGINILFDLRAVVEGWHQKDLLAIISPNSPVDLAAYLTADGKSADLRAYIVPDMIYIKKSISIALLEHKNLSAVVNSMCFSSDSRNIGAYVYPLMKKDLKAYIIGWNQGVADNLKDLTAYINVEDYTVQDRLLVRYVPFDTLNLYTKLSITSGILDKYYVTNNLLVSFSTFYKSNLSAAITGVLTSASLGASITPEFDYNYTKLPFWIKPKTHEVVINLERFEEQWRRFVELMFDSKGTDAYHYFYVDGPPARVYKVDKSRNWTVWAKSYDKDDTTIIDRRNVRHKYLFKMSNYNSIDEAIRDLIDRVSDYRRTNLSASITGMAGNYADINAEINSLTTYSWFKSLSLSIKGFGSLSSNINSIIQGVLLEGQLDVSASITSTGYTPPSGNNLILNFTEDSYNAPDYDDTNLNWTGEDAQ